MKKHGKLLLKYLLLFVMTVFVMGCFSVSAATKTGFVTQKGKTYYINKDGSKQKGWLELKGKKYYFDKKTGVQVKGWVKDSSGQAIRYFTSGAGYMVTGFITDSNGNTRHFDETTGLMTRGWLTDTDEYKYYFYSGSGVMAKGWVENKKEQKRYFSQANGRMCTGWVKSSAGNYRYFKPSNGIMYTGLEKIDSDYYYFSKSTGVRYQKGFGTVGSKKYYFNPSDGKAKTGWLKLDGKKYYFKTDGSMAVSTTVTVSGVTYTISSTGVATVKTSHSNQNLSNGNVKVYDTQNSRYYTMVKEYKTHPGIANGKTTDEALLAALCESEAGDQGKIGMEAVALCVLNRTIKKDKEFPSTVRGVIYESMVNGTYPQYSVVRDGALLKRLKGNFENRTLAYQAAKKAMTIFNNYVKNGKSRTLTGFKQKDFNYMYFMMNSSFKKQPLTFSKVKYEVYKDHTFFVDWV